MTGVTGAGGRGDKATTTPTGYSPILSYNGWVTISNEQFRFVLTPKMNGTAIIDIHDTSLPDHHNQNLAGYMEWDEDELRDVTVLDQYQRRGLATEMWKRANEAHKEAPFHFPEPKPSNFRTQAGDQWAQALHSRGLSPKPPENIMNNEDEDEYDR